MIKCECGAQKWKTVWEPVFYVQCLKCYAKYTKTEVKKLKGYKSQVVVLLGGRVY